MNRTSLKLGDIWLDKNGLKHIVSDIEGEDIYTETVDGDVYIVDKDLNVENSDETMRSALVKKLPSDISCQISFFMESGFDEENAKELVKEILSDNNSETNS